MSNILNYFILFVIITSIDLTFLNLLGITKHFGKLIKKIQGNRMVVDKIGALLSYSFITFALYYFIISKKNTLLNAFILGVCVYGVYEYTNYALFSKWDFTTTIIDTLWGGILFVLCSFIYYKIKNIKIKYN